MLARVIRNARLLGHVGILVVLAQVAIADPIDINRVLIDALEKVVHLKIDGQKDETLPKDTSWPPIYGTGVVIKTSSPDPFKQFRILTAAHVVKDDDSWARLGSRRNRAVYIIGINSLGSQPYLPVTGVVVNSQSDIAEVFTNPKTRSFAELRPDTLVSGKQYVVVSWGLDSNKLVPEYPTAKLATARGPDPSDPTLVRLDANLVPTESGSPVLDSDGAVIAIVVMREEIGGSSSTALALPIKQVWDWISGVNQNPISEPRAQPLDQLVNSFPDKENWWSRFTSSMQLSLGMDKKPLAFVPNANLCVFLGKASALEKQEIESSDFPFGREMLETAAKNPSALLRRRLSINREAGGVDILSNCPDVQNGKVYYGSIVSVLDNSAEISLNEVEPLRYLDDQFYWGVISNIWLQPR